MHTNTSQNTSHSMQARDMLDVIAMFYAPLAVKTIVEEGLQVQTSDAIEGMEQS